MLPVTDFEKIVQDFIDELKPDSRDVSYDYCYNYFHRTRGAKLTEDMEKSCLVLGFYLASWGMLRGSSFLLQKSIKHYERTIEYLVSLDDSYWKIDVDNYSENIDKICSLYKDLKESLAVVGETPSVILVTKVMLGVFGIIPAFDTNFAKTFSWIFKDGEDQCSFTGVDKKSLTCLKKFYQAHKEFIDNKSKTTFTIGFLTEESPKLNYTKAKIIDMYGWKKAEN